MNRAYSLMTVKAVDESKRIIRGIATTPAVDRVGDIIEPLGVSFKNPLPFLWQHRHDQPIGTVTFDKPTKDGIAFTAEIPSIAEPGKLKDRTDEAWQSIREGLVRAVSIGFRPIEYSYIEGGGVRFTEVEVFELSAVTIPAQAEAIITSAKALNPDLCAVIKTFDERDNVQPVPVVETTSEATKDDAASGKKTVRVVRLNDPARARAKPFVIRSIRR